MFSQILVLCLILTVLNISAETVTDGSLDFSNIFDILKWGRKEEHPHKKERDGDSKHTNHTNTSKRNHSKKHPNKLMQKIYTLKRFYEDTPPKNIAVEEVFTDIIQNSTCTVYYFEEENEWDPLFQQYHDICHTAYDGYCIKIITSVKNVLRKAYPEMFSHTHSQLLPYEPYPWEWADFNYQEREFPPFVVTEPHREHILEKVFNKLQTRPSTMNHNHSKWYFFKNLDWPYFKVFGSSPKYADKCFVLFRSTDNIEKAFEEEPSNDKYHDLLHMPHYGRITPDFTFIFTKNFTCKPFFNSKNFGASVILIATLNDLSMVKYEGCPLDVSFKSVSEVKVDWLRAHGRIKIFKRHLHHNLTEQNRSSSFTFKVCGGTPLVQQYILSPPGQRQPQRIWDPQEVCVYETILAKHMGNNYSFAAKREFARHPYQWPFQMEYQNVLPRGDENDLKVGKSGMVYLPFTTRHQGFRYNIFLDKKQIRVEFDMASLLAPFDLLVWINFVAVLIGLSILWKISSNSFQLLFLFGVMLEQEVKISKVFFAKSRQVGFIAGLWLLTTISIRQCYTGKMFSAITAEVTPHTPETFKELLEDPSTKKFDIFVPSEQMQALLFSGKKNENITADMFWSVTKGLNSTGLREIIQEDTNQISFLQGSSKTVAKKHHSRIAFISYTHPSKLQFAGSAKVGEMVNKTWIPPFPYEAVLRMLGRRKFIRNREKPIRNYPWMYAGKRNYFTDFFAKDLSALVESGIYLRWEYLMCKYTEMNYLIRENKKSSNFTWNFYSAACRKQEESLRKPVSFKKASNMSIRVIWVLFSVCLIVSFIAYLKEIVRFDFIGRKCPCCGYSAIKYKTD